MKEIKWKYRMGQIIKDDKRNITIIDKKIIRALRKNGKYENKKYYKFHCNKCNFDCGEHYSSRDKIYKNDFWIEESNLLKGNGCACCSNKIVVQGINDIATTDPWMIKYFVNIEDSYIHTRKSNEKFNPICPICKKQKNKSIKISTLTTFKSIGCGCTGNNKQYPNKFMYNLLEQLGIEFESEYSPKWIERKRYDFYIPSMNLIIEMDGGIGHKGGIVYNNSNKTISQSIKNDEYKDKLAKEHDIDIIRINCNYNNIENRFAYIKNNIINSKLNDIFNFDNIDWEYVDYNAEENNVIKVCEYWKTNKNVTTSDVAEIFNLHRTTVNRYLKRGSYIGLCNYDIKEENKKRINKIIKTKSL
ncbi:hypothetical protein [Clostridium butyricum]|uniref:hypothetical protein n=1 Tax=Clostridium butyricum TaxID=1492 RepID=UPI00325ABE7B